MAVETLKKRTARLSLDNGTDGEGNQRYVYDNIPYIYKDGWDVDKFLAFVAALGPVLSDEILAIETTTVSGITAS